MAYALREGLQLQAEERAQAQTARLGRADQEADIPAGWLALIKAGLLDEADLESAMAKMTQKELDEDRAKTVPDWLRALDMDVAVEDSASGTEAEDALAEYEIPDWLRALKVADVEEIAPIREEKAPADDEINSWPLVPSDDDKTPAAED